MKNYGFKSCHNWLTIFITKLRPDMKTLIAADNAMIWQKDEKETEEKLDQWNLIIKEHILEINIQDS
jgi:hypothetical protein